MTSFVEDYVPFIEQEVVRVGPKKYCLPILFKEFAPKYYNLDVIADDVWSFGFPRSGTTLTEEAIWLLCNNLNYGKAAEIALSLRCPFLEYDLLNEKSALFDNETNEELFRTTNVERLNNMTERRFIKTHLPVSLLPPAIFTKQCKCFYIYRNPKDVVVSFYNFHKDFLGRSQISFDDFWKAFKNDDILWTPYFEHLKQGLALKDQKNCKILFYDEFIKNKFNVLKEMAEFLDQKYSDEQLKQLEEHLHIDNLKKSKSVNQDFSRPGKNFIRTGKSGGWKDYFTGGLAQDVDQWIHNNLSESELSEYFNNSL